MNNLERSTFGNLALSVIGCIIFAISCKHKEGVAVQNHTHEAVFNINIENDSSFLLNGRQVSFKSFDFTAKAMIDSIEQKGIMRDQVLVSFHVDNSIELGVIADLQSKLRDHNLRHITYSTK